MSPVLRATSDEEDKECRVGLTARWQFTQRLRHRILTIAAAVFVLLPAFAAAQGLTGALIGTVKDAQGGVVAGAAVRLSSPSLLGGTITAITDAGGQMRFPAVPPGTYVLEVTFPGFTTHHEEKIRIALGATIDVTTILHLAGVAEQVDVPGSGSRLEARDPGFSTRFGREDLEAIPSRRASMFDAIKSAPGISPTAPSSGTTNTFSAFGSGTNENAFLVDGTNQTCPCNGVARSEPGVDFIQEVHVQSAGGSAEFGNVQGAVINVMTKQGSDRFLYDASYYGQPPAWTAQPTLLGCDDCADRASGYGRDRPGPRLSSIRGA